jgi:hypothetical protein
MTDQFDMVEWVERLAIIEIVDRVLRPTCAA